MGYWRDVAKRAASEAAGDARLGDASMATLVVGQLVLATVLFFALGAASANFPTRAVTAALPFLVFPLFFTYRMMTAPPAIEAERAARIVELEQLIEDSQWAAIGGENARRHVLLSQFRELYKLSEDGLSPDLMAGLAWPPIEWMNDKLGRRGETWRVDRFENEKVFTRELE